MGNQLKKYLLFIASLFNLNLIFRYKLIIYSTILKLELNSCEKLAQSFFMTQNNSAFCGFAFNFRNNAFAYAII